MTRTELAAIWPPTASAAREAPHKPQSPLQAIREKCRDCSCYQLKEIRLCEAVNCALWPFRSGRHPWRAEARKAPLIEANSDQQTAFQDKGPVAGHDFNGTGKQQHGDFWESMREARRRAPKSGPETRGRSDRGSSLELARLPLDRHTAAGVARTNDPTRLWRENAWGPPAQPKSIFGPDTSPLNILGGYRVPGAPAIADVLPRRVDRTPTAEAKTDDDLDILPFLRRAP